MNYKTIIDTLEAAILFGAQDNDRAVFARQCAAIMRYMISRMYHRQHELLEASNTYRDRYMEEKKLRIKYQKAHAILFDSLHGSPCDQIRWQQEREELRTALEPLAKFHAVLEKQPLRGTGDILYSIHGREDGAQLTREACKRAYDLLTK